MALCWKTEVLRNYQRQIKAARSCFGQETTPCDRVGPCNLYLSTPFTWLASLSAGSMAKI